MPSADRYRQSAHAHADKIGLLLDTETLYPAHAFMAGERLGRQEAAGLTREAVAKEIDRPKSFVSKVENEERRIDPIFLGGG